MTSIKIRSETAGVEEETVESLAEDVNSSIQEMERRLADTRAFQAKLLNGTLTQGDSYLSFGAVLIHGYGRTGPDLKSVWTQGPAGPADIARQM